jgi:hypothetical protein
MKLTLEKVIGAIVVVVLGYMIYTHFLSRPTMVKTQKGKHKQSESKESFCQGIQQKTLQKWSEGSDSCNVVGNNCVNLLCKNDPKTTSTDATIYCLIPAEKCDKGLPSR